MWRAQNRTVWRRLQGVSGVGDSGGHLVIRFDPGGVVISIISGHVGIHSVESSVDKNVEGRNGFIGTKQLL